LSVELSAPVILSMLTVLAVFGTKLWALGAKVESAATRDEINAREALLRKEFEAAIKDKSKESVEAHRDFAHKSGVTKIEAQMFDIEKETAQRFETFRKEVNARFDEMRQNDTKILDMLVKINARVTPRGEQL